ncbi:MAG: hypothetical protein HQK91_11625 [Nitrospirae bacterium]|nr:hypothetical protein [Nitrospirota bacterium]
MTTKSIETVIKMMESVPEPMQDYIIEEIRRIITEANDDKIWENLFNKNQEVLIEASQKAKAEIKAGFAKPMDFERL